MAPLGTQAKLVFSQLVIAAVSTLQKRSRLTTEVLAAMSAFVQARAVGYSDGVQSDGGAEG
jgi:hypothetical protein